MNYEHYEMWSIHSKYGPPFLKPTDPQAVQSVSDLKSWGVEVYFIWVKQACKQTKQTSAI